MLVGSFTHKDRDRLVSESVQVIERVQCVQYSPSPKVWGSRKKTLHQGGPVIGPNISLETPADPKETGQSTLLFY